MGEYWAARRGDSTSARPIVPDADAVFPDLPWTPRGPINLVNDDDDASTVALGDWEMVGGDASDGSEGASSAMRADGDVPPAPGLAPAPAPGPAPAAAPGPAPAAAPARRARRRLHGHPPPPRRLGYRVIAFDLT